MNLGNIEGLDRHVLVLSPLGRDGTLIVKFLEKANIAAELCANFDETFERMRRGAGAVVIAEEALNASAIDRLAGFLAQQPSWSDFPLVLLTAAGKRSVAARQRLGNVLLLERPVSPETLVSTLRGVLRSRDRQYQVRDYLEEKLRTENALRESEKQFRDLANAIPQLAWMAHANGDIFWYNERWFEYTGTTLAEMYGWGWQSVHDPSALPIVLEHWRRALAAGEGFEMTFPLRGADGKFRPFLTLVKPIKNSAGEVVRWFGTNTDVSSQKRAEQALIKTEKLAAAGRLAASISHEINNPLEAVTNLLYILETEPELAPQHRDIVRQAQTELKRVSHITTHTLRFYRESMKAADICLPELLESVISLYKGRLAQANIRVHSRFTDINYLGFPGELRQVLANLIGNAIDAMPQGGDLYLRVRHSYDYEASQPGVRIAVADTGCGMSSDVLARIFEPFFTTKEATGTGLGLFVSKEIVEKVGGKLAVRSSTKTGHSGTVFSIFLPSNGKYLMLPTAD